MCTGLAIFGIGLGLFKMSLWRNPIIYGFFNGSKFRAVRGIKKTVVGYAAYSCVILSMNGYFEGRLEKQAGEFMGLSEHVGK